MQAENVEVGPYLVFTPMILLKKNHLQIVLVCVFDTKTLLHCYVWLKSDIFYLLDYTCFGFQSLINISLNKWRQEVDDQRYET